MATKLGIFNNSLRELGHRRLSDTGEAIQAGRELVSVYDDVVADCLADADWNFAIETIKAESDTGVDPDFGFAEVFAKPSDWVRTTQISEDEYFTYPLLHYYDDANFWSADSTPIYVRYVSNDTGLGMELTRWTAKFRRYVELEMASRVAYTLTQNASLEEMVAKKRDRARKDAKNFDAMNEPQPSFPPPSSWTLARGGRLGRGDRGSRNKLTG